MQEWYTLELGVLGFGTLGLFFLVGLKVWEPVEGLNTGGSSGFDLSPPRLAFSVVVVLEPPLLDFS